MQSLLTQIAGLCRDAREIIQGLIGPYNFAVVDLHDYTENYALYYRFLQNHMTSYRTW